MAEKELTSEEVDAKKLRQSYLDCISTYDKKFKSWSGRVDKILERYRDEKRTDRDTGAKFNILWSNVQTLVPATFSQLPQPDVTRRFKDNDPVGRVASMILERCLDFEVQHYPDYRQTLKSDVYDRFLGGRGQAWVRYEPHFSEMERPDSTLPDDGLQVTEDTDEAPIEEQLDYECAPLDYVHWKDFGHEVARTWEEVTKVWRNVYMDESAVKERFGEEVAKKLPYDATPEDKDKEKDADKKKQALIIELWDKTTGEAVWFSKSAKMGEFLDRKTDPLKLQEFFPCPRPLYASLTNDSLIPVPDFTLYQDQAQELDILADRIKGLAEMLQVKGVYDASADSSLARLFTEGTNGQLLPVKNWAAFAEKNGLKGQVDIMDLTPIYKALEAAYNAMEQGKNQIYEITGIADIIRGVSSPSETLGAQEIKQNFVGLRLKDMQDDVAMFATECLRLKAQIMCAKFSPETLMAMAAVEQLSPEDQQMVEPALALLVGEERLMDPEADSPNPLRSFRIEIAADTLVKINEQQEKQDRVEMITAVGTYIEKAVQAAQMAPEITPLLVDILKFGMTAFKVGKQIEGTFDQALDQMKEQAKNPQPQGPPPEVQVEQMKQQGEQAKLQQEGQLKQAQLQSETAMQQQKLQNEAQATQAQVQADVEKERLRIEANERIEAEKRASEERIALARLQQERELGQQKMEMERATRSKDEQGKDD